MLRNGQSINSAEFKMANSNTNYKKVYGYNIADEGDEIYREYRYKWNNNPKNNIVENFPLFLDIEATSACNLNCPYCDQTNKKIKNAYISFDLYKKIIDEASEEGCYGIKFHAIGRGEPLLHRDIVKLISYATKKGLIDTYFNTNALLLNERIAKGILDSGLNRISFSLDGYNKKTYESNRVGSKWETVRRNVKRFYELRESKKYKTLIRIQSVDLKNINKKQYTKVWKDYCDEIGFLKYRDQKNKAPKVESDWQCPQPWQRMAILWNGDILPCNHDNNCNSILDNVNNTTIKKIWQGSAMRYIRELHLQGKSHFLTSCDDCHFRASEIKR